MTIHTSHAVVIKSWVVSALTTGLVALDVKIDQSVATVIVGIFVMVASMWQSYMLTKVHTLVNSNFSEAKAARALAEAALKTSQDLNLHLQQQLDARAGVSLTPLTRATDPKPGTQ